MSSVTSQGPLSEVPYFSFYESKYSEGISDLIKRVQDFISPFFTAIQEVFTCIVSWCYKAEDLSLSSELFSEGVLSSVTSLDSINSEETIRTISPFTDNTQVVEKLSVDDVLKQPSYEGATEGVEGEEAKNSEDVDLSSPLQMNLVMGNIVFTKSPDLDSMDLLNSIENGCSSREEAKAPERSFKLSQGEIEALDSFVETKQSMARKFTSNYTQTKDSVYGLSPLGVISRLVESRSIGVVANSIKWKKQLTEKLSIELSNDLDVESTANSLASLLESDSERIVETTDAIKKLLSSKKGGQLFDYIHSYNS